ncbi:MAG: DNA helicase [Halobacteriovoraceae bacterium]|nr:DNA helicase [Halobacteriovoraceae bacterium]|tara:strand:- start:11100 stop:11927 length:828 start_codon:yes stop_codon:yes gene_type:complete
MKLSSPIHVLKSQAKELKRSESLSMIEALDKIAQREGYSSWSLLQSKNSSPFPKSYSEVLDFLNEGDLLIIGARPGMGKTSFTIGLFVMAVQRKLASNYYFTLNENHKDIAGRISIYDKTIGNFKESLGYPGNEHLGYIGVDYSNAISADYIIEKTKATISKKSVIVVDYLQLLDEKRINPPLQKQVEKLKKYAKETGCIIIFISQVRREIENQIDKTPRLADIRLPNPLELNLFNKIILLYRKEKRSEKVKICFYRPKEHQFEVSWDWQESRFS